MRKFWSGLLWIILLAGCSSPTDIAPVNKVVITRVVTATPQPTLTASLTPTATQTPTPTPTPTPTAPKIVIEGDPRAFTLFDPIPQPGAPCGWADTLDFPLAPPDGDMARGGSDFGRYRSRYEKYHAGEDWGLSNRNNFGKPVHSISHGQVTYAQPVGWGADKGVVIVRHAFSDGDLFLSFYGHLDPPSVTLKEGDCVNRGDIVGQIGRPRTPPHLHFEIRVHFPYSTGGGYWSTDPAEAGWLPPSQTVSQYRLQVSPGVLWTAEPAAASNPLGVLDETTFLMIAGDNLVAIDLVSGEEQWLFKFSEQIKDAQLDLDDPLLYVIDSATGLSAYALPEESDSAADELEPLWVKILPLSSRRVLYPLPGGGVLINDQNTLSAFTSQGNLLWKEELDGALESWAIANDEIVFTTAGNRAPLITASTDGVEIWEDKLSGTPLVADDQVWLYAEDGLYRLNLTYRTTQRIYTLPTAVMRRSAAVSLSNGNLLLLHTDSADRRLLLFNSTGELVWEFSVPLDGEPFLFELGSEIYLALQPAYSSSGSYRVIEIFAIDLEQEILNRVFAGGSRAFNPRTTWMAAANDQGLLIHLGGTGSVYFNPESARQRMDP